METWGIREGVLGMAVIALGTSLPELTVSINSARRGFGRLLIGNVVGSNIVNISLGLGLAPFFTPIQVEYSFAILTIMFAFCISLIFFYMIRRDWKVTRFEGFILLVLYAFSQIVLIYVSLFISS
jgi:cation:H+ antiporter